jgi:hypothetical protein
VRSKNLILAVLFPGGMPDNDPKAMGTAPLRLRLSMIPAQNSAVSTAFVRLREASVDTGEMAPTSHFWFF